MGWYNVVKPCVVGQLHYARPTAQPIDVDDEVAAELVENGSLESYPSAASPDPLSPARKQEAAVERVKSAESALDEARRATQSRRARRAED